MNFTSTVGSQVSVTSGPSRRHLGSSRSVLGGWRLSQMSPRTELDSCYRSHPQGSFVFITDLEGAEEDVVSYPL